MFLRSKRKLPLTVAAGLLVIIGGILAASCRDHVGSGGSTDNANVLNAINILDKAGLHGIDDSINKDRTIPASARTTAQQLQAVTSITEWPSDLEDEADALAEVFEAMAAALEGGTPDLTKAGEAAAKAHDAQHDFSHEVWEYLYEKGGVETGASEGH